jgi:hypothetical protein
MFRGKYLDGLCRALAHDRTLADTVDWPALRQHDWVVYAKKSLAGPRDVLDYLARYTQRIALTNDRLLGIDHGVVRLRWRDYAHGAKKKVLRLAATELLQRFLLHVVPRGFQRVRHYGLLGNRHKTHKLAACHRYFGTATATHPSAPQATLTATALLARMGIDPDCCHACGSRCIRRESLAATPLLPRARAPTRAVS